MKVETNFYSFDNESKITVVASLMSDNTTRIGIAKCGPDQRCDKELGKEIAERRAEVKPDAIINRRIGTIGFCAICDFINYNAGNNSQWNHKYLPRVDNKETKKSIEVIEV